MLGSSIALGFVLGILHALEPGHGKTAMFVYMLRGQKSYWHPIVMGFSTAVSHAVSLVAIALVVHLGVHFLAGDEQVGHQTAGEVLQWISSILLLGVGFRLLWLARYPKQQAKSCACCKGKPSVSSDSHDERLGQVQASDHASHTASERSSLKLTVLIGIAVGLLPCPTALASYFAGMSSGDIWQGYLVIAVFSAGIGLSLAACGFLLQWVGGSFRKYIATDSSRSYLGYVQALAIIGISMFYLARLLATGEVHQHDH